ncbi:MAG: Fur family transcriptional regulator [Candidatus Freyarchaeota archaeon]
MEKQLKKHGMKITPQRRELIKILGELGKYHPSFNQVYEAIRRTHPNISRSTVFNNLKTMVELNLIKSFNYEGETRYETNPELHINIVEPDGKITDLNNNEVKMHLEEIVKIISKGGKSVEILVILIK